METNTGTTPGAVHESPTTGRKWGWLAEVNRGQVPAREMQPRHAQVWFPEDVQAVMELAKERPGHPLAISVHATTGSSGSSLRKRKADHRWTLDTRYTLSTRTLHDPEMPNASAIVLIFTPRDAQPTLYELAEEDWTDDN